MAFLEHLAPACRGAMVLASLWQFLVPMSVAQVQVDPACDLYQSMVLGQEYYVYNRQYPSTYGPNTACRWVAASEPGTRIVVACEDVDMPATTDCTGDKLAISQSGDQNFQDAHNYCGKGGFTIVTPGNAVAIGLFSTSSSVGGKFVCTLTAIEDNSASTTAAPPICDCGWKQTTRIVGGQDTGVNEYPAMAALIEIASRDLFCGATILSNRYILSAGHCLYNRNYGNIAVLVGDHNISTGNDTPYAALYRVEAFEIHPDYNPDSLVNDVAIIRTVTEIQFSFAVGPICLPFRYTSQTFAGQTVTALGWGTLEYTGRKSDTLQKIDISVVSNSECSSQQGTSITSNQLCTFAQGKDTCQSDSGGPLLWFDTSTRRLQLVGVISYGLACASARPGVNTRVTSHLTWIIERTGDANYCIK